MAFSPDGKTLGVVCFDGNIRFWEVSGGGLRYTAGIQTSWLAFCPRGSLLATADYEKGDVHLWDWRDPGLKRGERLTGPTLETLWKDGAAADAAVGYQAVARLIAVPRQAVEFLGGRLKRVEPVSEEDLNRFVKELDADEAATRNKALARLEALGGAAEAKLRTTLESRPSAEVRKSVSKLLDYLGKPNAAQRRALRSIEILEAIASAEARRVLQRLAEGAAGAIETEDAKGALRRIERVVGVKP